MQFSCFVQIRLSFEGIRKKPPEGSTYLNLSQVNHFCPTEEKRLWTTTTNMSINGGSRGIRTPDLLVANEALSQLSYRPIALIYYDYLYEKSILFLTFSNSINSLIDNSNRSNRDRANYKDKYPTRFYISNKINAHEKHIRKEERKSGV